MLSTLSFATALALALASGDTPPTLWINVSSAGQCSAEALEVALRRRIPDLALREGAAPETGDALARIEEASGQWTLMARGPAGALPLQRALPTPQGDCLELTQTAALMIDRYLTEIHWEGAASVPFASLDVASPVQRSVSAAGTPVTLVLELAALAGVGPVAVWPGLRLDVGLRRAAFQLGVSAGLTWPQETSTASESSVVTYTVGEAPLEVVAGYRLRLGPGTLELALAPGAELFWGAGSGPLLFHTKTSEVVLPEVGARTEYELSLPWRLAMGLRAEVRVPLGKATFSATGYSGGITTGSVEGDLALSISRLFL